MKHHFRKGKKPHEVRERWCKESLREISAMVGREEEYDTFVYTFNGCTHSSLFGLRGRHVVQARNVTTHAVSLVARVVALNADHHKLDLKDDSEIVAHFCKSLLHPMD